MEFSVQVTSLSVGGCVVEDHCGSCLLGLSLSGWGERGGEMEEARKGKEGRRKKAREALGL